MTEERKIAIEPWFGFLTPPVAFLVNMQVNFMLVPWVCGTGQYWTIHLAHLTTTLLIAAAGWMSWRVWERVGRGVPGEDGHGTDRDRFLAMMGMLSAAFFLLLLAAHWIPNFLLGACQ